MLIKLISCLFTLDSGGLEFGVLESKSIRFRGWSRSRKKIEEQNRSRKK